MVFRIALVFASLCLGTVANASYPVACQLELLNVAAPALKADPSMGNFFDLTKVTFEVSHGGEPVVSFVGKGADFGAKQTCRADVTMQVPEDVLGCPAYVLKSVVTSCQ